MPSFRIIAFDADDTLWHNERLYIQAQARLKELLSAYTVDEGLDERLYLAEGRNLEHFGYGIKAFALSMIETAIELTSGRISAADIQSIIDAAREMLVADVELLDHVAETLANLAATHTLMLITKGDLRDQETKVSRSGIAQYFSHIEIVSDKSPAVYRTILTKHATPPSQFLMVGNSLRSDVLPVLELGGTAVYVPGELTWAHETAEAPSPSRPDFYQLEHLGQLPALVARLEDRPSE